MYCAAIWFDKNMKMNEKCVNIPLHSVGFRLRHIAG